MPKISTENRQYYKARMRSVIAQHPQITRPFNTDSGRAGG